MGDHWAETDLQDYFGQKGFGGDSLLGVSERANLEYTPQMTPDSRNFAEALDPMDYPETNYLGGTDPKDDSTTNPITNPITDPKTTPPGTTPPGTSPFTRDQLGYMFQPYPGQWERPESAYTPYPDVPQYAGPDRPTLPGFSYEKFQAPTMAQAQAEPGYQFAMQEATRALEASAAAKGLLRSGQTWNDLQTRGQEMGAQNYQNVYDRALKEYGTGYDVSRDIWNIGRQNLVDAYKMERQEARDVFEPQMMAWPHQFTMAGRDRDQEYDRSWEEYLHQKQRWEEDRDLITQGLGGMMGWG